MRVGLFGGSFDPPHLGHLAVAEEVRSRFALDRILLAPAAIQPLKTGAHASFTDRLHMVELLCKGRPGIEASAIDAPRPDGSPNYTIDTIRRLRDELPADAEIFVILGADAFLGIRHWKSADELLREARWIVVSRPGFNLSALDALGLTPEQSARIETLNDFANPVSATEVRHLLHEHASATSWVPAKVLEYIKTHHLYGS